MAAFVTSAIVNTISVLDYGLGFLTSKPQPPAVQSLEIDTPAEPGEGRIRRTPSMIGRELAFAGDFETLAELAQRSVDMYPRAKAVAWRPIAGTYQKEIGKAKEGEKPKLFTITKLAPTQSLTYAEFGQRINHIGAGLVALGLQPGGIIALYEETRAEWFTMAHSAWQRGLVVATVYANLGDDGLAYALHQTEAPVVFANGGSVRKLLTLKGTEKVKTIVYTDKLDPAVDVNNTNGVKVLSVEQLEELGRNNAQKATPPKAEDVACIMYTSGTTDVPKGVVMTHANMIAAVHALRRRCLRIFGTHRFVGFTYLAYLPLAHILELAAETMIFSSGATIAYGTPRTLTDQSAEPHGDIIEFRPDFFAGVPRIYDTIKKAAEAKIAKASPLVQAMFATAYANKVSAIARGRDTPLWNLLVFRKFKSLFGGRVRFAVSGGAPLNPKTQEFIRVCVGCGVGQGYGLTETCAMLTLQHYGDEAAGSVGGVQAGLEVKLVDIPEMNYLTSDRPPRGEVLVRGLTITKGYFKLPDKTAEAFLPGGWFATGDVGEWQPDGSLRIIDRKKNLVKLAMGEYVALEKLETTYSNSHFVMPNGICCVADPDKTFVVALILVSREAVMRFAAEANLTGEFSEILKSTQLYQAVAASLEKEAKSVQLKAFEKVKHFRLFDDEWTPENEMTTAALKLKRKNIHAHYQSHIDAMYREG